MEQRITHRDHSGDTRAYLDALLRHHHSYAFEGWQVAPTAIAGVMVGYDSEHKGYRICQKLKHCSTLLFITMRTITFPPLLSYQMENCWKYGAEWSALSVWLKRNGILMRL